MRNRSVHLHYSFQPDAQRGADMHHPLFDLLNALHGHGSIQHAAKAMGASYRHVWGALKQWEEVLGEPLVTWAQGQPARLTPLAERLMWAETRARARMAPHLEALRVELERVVAEALEGEQIPLSVCASPDRALSALQAHVGPANRVHVAIRWASNLEALNDVVNHRCLLAGVALPTQEVGASAIGQALKPLLKSGRYKALGCVRRTLGRMTRPNSPLASGEEAPPHDHTSDEPLADAASVASGQRVAVWGLEAAAHAFNLAFTPGAQEDYVLVGRKEALEHPAVIQLSAALHSAAWAEQLATLPGYAVSEYAGQVLPVLKTR